MSASKAYLYLATFESEGLVKQEHETGHYGLGPSAIQLGLAAIRQLDVVRLAGEQLDKLHELTQCAAYISIWGNRGPVIASKVDGDWQGSMAVRVGYVLPLLRSSTGRIFHAYLPKTETRKLVAEELNGAKGWGSPLTKDDLDRSAEEAKSLGYATSENQVNIGFASVSAPVFDYSQRLVGTLTVLGPSAVLNKDARREAARHLIEAAATMCAQMGGTVPATVVPNDRGKSREKFDAALAERVGLPEG